MIETRVTDFGHGSLTVTVFTVQKKSILERVSEEGVFRAEWDRLNLSRNELIAYRHAATVMGQQGLPIGEFAPIWGWQTSRQRLYELAGELLSENERNSHDYGILELAVPEELILRTSYHEWCNAFFETIETGCFPSNDGWLDYQDLDEDDVIQVLLPYVLHTWQVSILELT